MNTRDSFASGAKTGSRRAVGDRRGAHKRRTAEAMPIAAGCFARRRLRADSDSADPIRPSVLLAGNRRDPKRKITQNQTRAGRKNRNQNSRNSRNSRNSSRTLGIRRTFCPWPPPSPPSTQTLPAPAVAPGRRPKPTGRAKCGPWRSLAKPAEPGATLATPPADRNPPHPRRPFGLPPLLADATLNPKAQPPPTGQAKRPPLA